MLGIEVGGRHVRRRIDDRCGGRIVRWQIEAAVGRYRQAIDGQTEFWQDIIIDDVIHKHAVRVECVLFQDHAVIKWARFGNRAALGMQSQRLL